LVSVHLGPVIVVGTDGRMAVLIGSPYLGALSNGSDWVKGRRRISKGGSEDLQAAREWGDDAFTRLSNLRQKRHRRDPTHWYVRFWRCCRPPLGPGVLADASTPQPFRRSSTEQRTGVIAGHRGYALADQRTSDRGLRGFSSTSRSLPAAEGRALSAVRIDAGWPLSAGSS
jgi:hypothetical protein